MTITGEEQTAQLILSPEDVAALAQRAADLSDVPKEALAAATRRQQRAYDTARRIVDGTLDPLSA